MGQNYNLNSTFGMNVSSRNTRVKPEKPQKTNIDSTIGDLLDNFVGFSPEIEKVYNGDVEKQINMYSRQAMIVGMNLKNAEVKRNFDVNI